MNYLHVSPAPHIHSGLTTQKVMLDVIIALAPSAIVSVVLFKLKALWLILACVAAAVLCEFVFNLIVKKKQTVSDLSAVVTGLILALNLSANVKIWQAVCGSVFAIIIVKSLFGGLGKNIVNPAIGARVFMLLTFASVAGGANPDLSTGATPLAVLKEGLDGAPSILNLFLGNVGGTIGETCAIAILLGYAYLVIRKQIKWYVPCAFIGTVFVCYLVYSQSIVMAVSQVLAGGLLFGAVFMATDYVTTPISNLGKVVFCVGCGLITFAIRAFGAFPEGVSISILCMNLLTPLIEKVTKPRTLGGIK
ncbi:MAG: RnfABCDGE type electron transport complex subunit D [Clostridia bacterium]|nr:RnfABCDGE type electron transport complex subunit D [Clostridia bacterium]